MTEDVNSVLATYTDAVREEKELRRLRSWQEDRTTGLIYITMNRMKQTTRTGQTAGQQIVRTNSREDWLQGEAAMGSSRRRWGLRGKEAVRRQDGGVYPVLIK